MQPISRVKPAKQVMTVDEAVAADRKYFDENPDEDEYIREFVPGEFGKIELSEIPEGLRYAPGTAPSRQSCAAISPRSPEPASR